MALALATSRRPARRQRPRRATGPIAPITVHGEPAGRVVLDGPRPTRRLLEAAAGALAAALSLAVAAGIEHGAARSPRPTSRAELAHGRRLQRSFVSLVPPDVPGYDIATHYEAAREVGGDFFDLFRLRRRGRPLSLVIADVTGKGIAAALLMAFSRPLLHAAIDHTIGPGRRPSSGRTRVLVGERRTSLFITALCARLDVRDRAPAAGQRRPRAARCSSRPTARRRRSSSGPGRSLGAFPELDLPEHRGVAWRPATSCLLYTDGVTDAQAARRRPLRRARPAGGRRARRGAARPRTSSTRSSATLEAFAAGAEPADDITMVALGRRRARLT